MSLRSVFSKRDGTLKKVKVDFLNVKNPDGNNLTLLCNKRRRDYTIS